MIVRTVSHQEAQAFLHIPAIWACAAIDDSPETFEIPDTVALFGGVIEDATLAGLVLTHPYRDGAKLHYYVLRPYRLRIARELLRTVLDRHVKVRPLYVAIPVTHRPIINFAKHAGFRYFETEHDAWHKAGVTHDREILRK